MSKLPKGKLMALLAVLAAIGLITATGAFGAVQAERTVTVNVAGDAAALLQIQSLDDDYANENSDGVLQIDFSSGGLSNAAGVNPNASTIVPRLFNVTNQGTNSITLNYTKSGTNADSVLLLNSTNSNANSQDPLHDGSPQTLPKDLSVGETYAFGMMIDTSADNGAALGNSSDFEVTLTLNATDSS